MPELAQTAYEAYSSDNDGAPAPFPWNSLPERTQARWRRVVRATLEAASGGGPRPAVEPGTADGDDRYG